MRQAADIVPGDETHRESILRRRAEQLARPLPGAEFFHAGESILIFRLAGNRYAAPLPAVAEVLARAERAVVPGAAPEVAGLIQVRGDICPVFHLTVLLGIDAPPASDRTMPILLVRTKSRLVGLLVDEIEEVRTVSPDGRKAGPPERPHILWVTDDLAAILDIAALIDKEE